MKSVEIYQLQNDGSQIVIATCRLEDRSVVCEGNETLIEVFSTEGIKNYDNPNSPNLFPKDGIIFLNNLQYHLATPYLSASPVHEKEEPNIK